MILELFILKGTATESKWEIFRKDIEIRAQKAKEIAEKYNLLFVPLQKKFDEMDKNASADYRLIDGIHTSAAGHEIIKREWIKAFNSTID